jgi:arylsulfatase A
VDSLRITENTMLILTSDNGSRWLPQDIEKFGHRANYVFRGMKSDAWEGGHHVPFLVRWPLRVEMGTRSGRLVCLNDLLATCAELTGQMLDWNAGEDSFSFLGALTGEASAWEQRSTLVSQAITETYAIRRGNWKLISGMSSGGWSSHEISEGPPMQLYNLDEDIGEQKNLFEQMPEKAAELEALLDMFMKEGRSRY